MDETCSPCFFPQTSVALPCFGFRCHSPCRRPWRIPAGTQTAKDTSCQDLMTRVISPRGNVSFGAARPVSPGPHLLQGPAGVGGGGGGAGGGPLPPFYTIATAPDDRRPEQRLKWAINVQGTPPPAGVSPLPPWGADEGVE